MLVMQTVDPFQSSEGPKTGQKQGQNDGRFLSQILTYVSKQITFVKYPKPNFDPTQPPYTGKKGFI